MSYDLALYKPEFLTRALEQQLGDWTNADPIPADDIDAIIGWLRGRGYVEQVRPWPGDGRGFRHAERAYGIDVLVSRGSVEFAIAYGPDAERAVNAALTDTRQISTLARLALYDPQLGEIEG
jgi:hypothetical protein